MARWEGYRVPTWAAIALAAGDAALTVGWGNKYAIAMLGTAWVMAIVVRVVK